MHVKTDVQKNAPTIKQGTEDTAAIAVAGGHVNRLNDIVVRSKRCSGGPAKEKFPRVTAIFHGHAPKQVQNTLWENLLADDLPAHSCTVDLDCSED